MFKADESGKDEIKQVQRRFRALPKEVKNDFRKYQRQELNPIWREEVEGRAGVTPEHTVMFRKGARVKAGAPASLIAGASTKTLSGGGRPVDLARPYEYGTTKQGKYTKYYRKSKNGGNHTVTRRTRAQIPTRRKRGWVAGEAFKQAMPRIVSLHVQTMYKRIYDSIEGKG